MSPSTKDRFDRSAGALAAEETLRMIAKLAAPEGLEDRMKAGLRSAPRRGAVIAWPPSASPDGWMHSAGVRASAAAAIVLAVAGGGWGVYSHIQIAPVPSAFVEQPLQSGAGRFSTAGAMHVPKTVQGPAVAAPVVEKQKQETGKASQNSDRHSAKKGKLRPDAPVSANQPPAVQ